MRAAEVLQFGSDITNGVSCAAGIETGANAVTAATVLRLYHSVAKDAQGVFVLTAIEPAASKGTKKPTHPQQFRIGDATSMAAEAEARGQTANVYFAPALIRPDLAKGRRGEERDITEVLALVLEEDGDTGKHVILPPGMSPTFEIETSRNPTLNRHFHWVFERPLTASEAKALAQLAHRKCGGDFGGKDIAHIWRLPGTFNFPDWRKIERGRPREPQPVRLIGGTHKPVSVPALRVALEAMPDRYPEPKQERTTEWQAAGSADREEILGRLPLCLREKIECEGQDRSAHVFSVLMDLFTAGLTDSEVLLMAATGAPFCRKYDERGDLEAEIGRVRAKWLAQSQTAPAGGNTGGWGEALPIQAPLLPVPAFDADVLLPPILRDWILDIACRMPCPPEYVAAPALVSVGTIIGARCTIKPKQRDDWAVVANLWGGIVGPPSSKKSPAISEAMKPLDRLVALAIVEHQRKNREFEADALISDARKDALETEIKKAAKAEREPGNKKSAPLDRLKEELLTTTAAGAEPPALRRYRTNDTTVEKLGELLRDNPSGLLVSRDELVGLLASWDKEGREGDRAFYLESWNGNSPFDTDRIGRGSILIPNLCTSIFGGIQPDKLTMYLEQAVNSLANDGMLQRFQLLVYPDPVRWQYVDNPPNESARQQVFELFEALDGFDPVEWGAAPADAFNRFPAFRFDSDAQSVFIEWASGHHGKNESEDNPLIAQHLAKYDKLFPALALIFHLIDCAAGKPRGSVTEDCALRAAAWCEFLETHARRCYGLLADNGLRAAQMLASKIGAGALEDGFTARDVRQKQWRYLTKDEAIGAALEWLEDSGWLQAEQIGGTGPGSGRRTTRYRINPQIGKRSKM